MDWVESDGGRAAAGYQGKCSDCVTRAGAIASGLSYADVYAIVKEITGASPRKRVANKHTREIMARLGGRWAATMRPGSGCTVHLCAEELPAGRIVAKVSRHVVACIDGICYDDHDPRRGATRCVYGYWVFD